MRVDSENCLKVTDEAVKRYEFDDYTVLIKGFLFHRYLSSSQLIAIEFQKLLSDPASYRFQNLFGSYQVILNSKKTKLTLGFGDNAGILKPYISSRCFSTLIWDFTDTEALEHEELLFNKEAIADWFHFSTIHENATFLSNVQRLDRRDYVLIENGKFECRKKRIPELADTDKSEKSIPPDEVISAMMRSTNNESVSLDLTGGQDSRLILSLMHLENTNFETALSGPAEHPDLVIAKSLAKKLDLAHHPTYYEKSETENEGLREIVRKTQGTVNCLWFQRIKRFSLDRQNRGISLQLTGIGGEGFKDFHWLQDFPFLWNKKTNVERYYDLRVAVTAFPHELFGNDLRAISENTRARHIKTLQNLALETNTRSLDNIYVNFICQGFPSANLAARSEYVTAYAPLMEPEALRFAFQLPRSKRVFAQYHRQLVTLHAPSIAGIKTTNGTSLKAGYLAILEDTFAICADATKRLLKVVSRKIRGKGAFENIASGLNNEILAKDSEWFHECVKSLKHLDILSQDVAPADIPDKLVGNIATLALFIRETGIKT